ncbi:hypothetical protein B0T25DRAFT_314533 [Lasiosphaeria hispida]|uniref:Uncharacterized protein n=1 Tax=Lasiosphaeria hispida TaxID=260671 RepID=A0AAJ0M9W9_9PEZI|nr:hypothetical protein B0T25DRAFT_314533 [Lasiosphaeria hispida]
MADTTARLRRTFHYPADDSNDSSPSTPPVLDEEEQEALIATLSAQNRLRNAQFARALLVLPTVATIPYLLVLLRGGGGSPLIPLLSLTSLAATTFLLLKLPPTKTGLAALDDGVWPAAGAGPQEEEEEDDFGARRYRAAPVPVPVPVSRLRGPRGVGILDGGGASSAEEPLVRYLPVLNAVLSVVVALAGVISRRGAGQRYALLGLGNLPLVIYAVVLGSKMVMASVDPERELNELRYEYKGA